MSDFNFFFKNAFSSADENLMSYWTFKFSLIFSWKIREYGTYIAYVVYRPRFAPMEYPLKFDYITLVLEPRKARGFAALCMYLELQTLFSQKEFNGNFKVV